MSNLRTIASRIFEDTAMKRIQPFDRYSDDLDRVAIENEIKEFQDSGTGT